MLCDRMGKRPYFSWCIWYCQKDIALSAEISTCWCRACRQLTSRIFPGLEMDSIQKARTVNFRGEERAEPRIKYSPYCFVVIRWMQGWNLQVVAHECSIKNLIWLLGLAAHDDIITAYNLFSSLTKIFQKCFLTVQKDAFRKLIKTNRVAGYSTSRFLAELWLTRAKLRSSEKFVCAVNWPLYMLADATSCRSFIRTTEYMRAFS